MAFGRWGCCANRWRFSDGAEPSTLAACGMLRAIAEARLLSGRGQRTEGREERRGEGGRKDAGRVQGRRQWRSRLFKEAARTWPGNGDQEKGQGQRSKGKGKGNRRPCLSYQSQSANQPTGPAIRHHAIKSGLEPSNTSATIHRRIRRLLLACRPIACCEPLPDRHPPSAAASMRAPPRLSVLTLAPRHHPPPISDI